MGLDAKTPVWSTPAFSSSAHTQVGASSIQQHRSILAAQLSFWQDTLNRSRIAMATLGTNKPREDHTWFPYEPTWSCPVDELIGTYGDGVKWVCGIRDIAPPCIVYSAGSGGSAQFERSVLAQTACEVHIFDPTAKAGDTPDNQKRLHFHAIGFGARDGSSELRNGLHGRFELARLDTIMRRLNHTFLDVLKMDIEGYEGDMVDQFAEMGRAAPVPIGQLLIEVHANRIRGGPRSNARAKLFQSLQKSDFHVFHKEVNALHTSACEYAWTRVAPRCVQVAHGTPPQYVAVSYPWAKLLPLSCD